MEKQVYLKEEDVINKDYFNEFTKEESINVFCPICKGIVVEPYFCSVCQNSFCKICINKWKEMNGSCIYRCSNSVISPNRIMLQLLKRLKFKCQLNCGMEIDYPNVVDHYINACPKLEKEKLLQQIKGLEDENQELKDLILAYKTENSAIKTENSFLISENASLKSENSYIKSENIYIKSKLNSLKKTLESIFDQHKTITSQIETELENNQYGDQFCIAALKNQSFESENFVGNVNNFKVESTITNNVYGLIYGSIAIYKLQDETYYVACSTNSPKNNIEIYNLLENKLVKLIEGAHPNTEINISSVKYYKNKATDTNYLLSSSRDGTIKLWNIDDDYKSILNLSNAFESKYACNPILLIFERDQYYILGGGCEEKMLKIWDSMGNLLGNTQCENNFINDSEVYYVDNEIYILIVGKPGLATYDFKKKAIKRKYIAEDDHNADHLCALIEKLKGKLTVIDSDNKGTIRLWEFESGNLIHSIKDNGENPAIYSLCLWNEYYVLTGRKDRKMKIFDLNSYTFVKEYCEHSDELNEIRKVKIDKKEFLVTASYDHRIKLWSV